MIELSDRQSGRDDVQAGGETTSGPLDTSSVFSVAFMSFMSPLMRLGYSRPLVDDDIYPMPLQERVGSVYRKLDSNWKDAAPAGDVSLFKSLVRSFWPQSIRGGFMLLIAHAVSLTVPFIITDFVRYLTTACHDTTHGFLDALALFVATGCTSLAMNNAFYHNVRAAGSCRDSIMALIYTKSLKISAASRQATSTGETVNLMSADAQRVYESLIYIHFLWVAPLSVLVVTIILIYSLGYAALAGLLAMSLLIPYQWGNTSLAARFRRSMLRNTDKRIMSTSEMFAGIRVIKQYAWENHVAEKIAQIRDAEVVDLKNLQLVNTLGTAIVAVWPGIVSALIFITFVLQGEQLTTVIVFFVLSLLVAVRLPISMLQKSIQVVTDGWVSLRRINRFVCLPELDLRGRSIDTGAPGTIIVNNASFSWGGSSTFPILRSVSFQFPPKLLVAVIGSVASGKSSLLSAIIGELAVTKGSIDVSGTFAYISQQHWIQNKSVRENILFGKPFDSDRYTSVVHAAALMPDLSVLPSGDETEIGEQGINLSGGQKARIMFARACYADTDIVLLDDPFSAVDVATGNIMFQYGVKRLLSNSTRVITLNSHLHFLQEVDQIVLLLPSANDSSDTVVHTFHNYDEFCTAYPNFANEKGDRDQEPVSTPVMVASATKDVLVEEESVQTGTVEGHVYMTYLDHCMAGGGVWAAIFLVTIFSVSQILRIGSDFISAEWGQTYMPDQRFWIMLQSVVIAAALVLFIGRSFIFNSMTIRASRLLHDHILKRLLLAPIPTFFDVTPLGRIVNRFSKDMDQIDVLISDYLGQLMLYGFTLAFSIALACYATPWFSIPLVPILLIFYWVQRYYRQSGRQLKRIEGTSRSPIFSAFEETLTGLSTIRAHRKQDVFTKDAFSAIEKNSRALLSNQLAGRWLALRLDLISNLVIVGVAFIIAGLSCSVNVAVSVLGLVQTTQLTGLLQWTVRVSTEVENNMTAVERVMEYTNVPVESPSNTTFCPDDRWPESGEIVFNNVHARYRPELPLVLNGVDFSIRPMEKVGICGRTGSGKSSLLLCLLRIIEVDPCGGKIFVDNVPIDQVGRHALRSRISVIPQDAVLFSGNIRENLDPFNERVDSDVLHALEQVSLRSERSNVALDDPVSERGYNFSHGQRQLICIARALLRNSKIIICDEATAGIDSETDKLIQIAIKSLFKTRTVLTVAHRLETIADSDRILVIKEGRVQEFDTPINLINNTGGYLYNMIAGGGEGAIRRFRSLTTKVQKTEIRSVNRAS